MKVKFFYDQVKFRVRKAKETKIFLEGVIRDEKRIPGDLCFIFMNDEEIKKINKSFLGHDYYTDVISFEDNKGNTLNGEIYISIDRVRYNSKVYKVSARDELIRVMIHGILHLCGYDDNETKEKDKMFSRQEYLVKKYWEAL